MPCPSSPVAVDAGGRDQHDGASLVGHHPALFPEQQSAVSAVTDDIDN
jgi:hypothetical protein